MDFVFVVFSAYCCKLVHTTVNSTQKGLRSFFLHFLNIYYCKFDKHLRHKKNQSKDFFIYLFYVPLSLKNRLWQRCFPVSFAKFFIQNTSSEHIIHLLYRTPSGDCFLIYLIHLEWEIQQWFFSFKQLCEQCLPFL